MNLLECRGISLSYEGKTVLRDLSFELGRGDYLCIVGENGSGKSTLVRAILGLKMPDCGSITFGGQVTDAGQCGCGKCLDDKTQTDAKNRTSKPKRSFFSSLGSLGGHYHGDGSYHVVPTADGRLRRGIGYLPQQNSATGAAADFPASVREIVLSGCIGRHGMFARYGRADRRRADDAIERMDIGDLASRSWRQLSGGQRQRVLLARALCAADDLLLLDEPVSGLDPLATAALYSHIKRLNDEGLAIIMVSHDIGSALRDASHILHLQGRPLYFGTAEGYRDSEAGRRFIEKQYGGDTPEDGASPEESAT